VGEIVVGDLHVESPRHVRLDDVPEPFMADLLLRSNAFEKGRDILGLEVAEPDSDDLERIVQTLTADDSRGDAEALVGPPSRSKVRVRLAVLQTAHEH